MNDRNTEAFKEEARDLLGILESSLLDLEKNPGNEELVGSIFRSMHTIKGSGAMFGFDRVAAFTHDVESVYDLIRNGKIPVSKELINLTLSACDQIRGMIEDEPGHAADAACAESILESFRGMLRSASMPQPRQDAAGAGRSAIEAGDEPTASIADRYRIVFRPFPGLCANGTNPLLLLSELHAMGSCRTVAHTDRIPELDAMEPEACYVHWEIDLATDQGIDAIRDVFIFVEGDCELDIRRLSDADAGSRNPEEDTAACAAPARSPLTEDIPAQDAVLCEPSNPISVPDLERRSGVPRRKNDAEQSSSIRVPAERLDKLVNMVGELVTVQSRLTSIATQQAESQMLQVAEEVARLVAELRDLTMSIRMVPIGTIFSKFKRLVRDLAAELGKDIALEMHGGETELDKTVIERLNDPLVHLIRNSIDHGIEPPELRAGRGKVRQGTVTISAIHSGAHVLIEIKDDGSGFDAAAIRAKALEKGLISADAELQESELFALVFHPGFSTARSVTNISGRGVGMDVVKKNIEALQGTVDLASEKGAGTTITLKIPLTLVIIDGLLVEIGADCFVLPLAAIEECVELRRTEAERKRGRNLATIRGELVPYIDLRELLQIGGPHPEIEQIVTAVIDRRRIGLVVDRVIGQHQTVIKSLGRVYRSVEEVSGATILGDGKVALILDLAKLVKKAERVPARSNQSYRVH